MKQWYIFKKKSCVSKGEARIIYTNIKLYVYNFSQVFKIKSI